jgi:hypothetical protein
MERSLTMFSLHKPKSPLPFPGDTAVCERPVVKVIARIASIIHYALKGHALFHQNALHKSRRRAACFSVKGMVLPVCPLSNRPNKIRVGRVATLRLQNHVVACPASVPKRRLGIANVIEHPEVDNQIRPVCPWRERKVQIMLNGHHWMPPLDFLHILFPALHTGHIRPKTPKEAANVAITSPKLDDALTAKPLISIVIHHGQLAFALPLVIRTGEKLRLIEGIFNARFDSETHIRQSYQAFLPVQSGKLARFSCFGEAAKEWRLFAPRFFVVAEERFQCGRASVRSGIAPAVMS